MENKPPSTIKIELIRIFLLLCSILVGGLFCQLGVGIMPEPPEEIGLMRALSFVGLLLFFYIGFTWGNLISRFIIKDLLEAEGRKK